ncbi:MAG TPA: hypothetical protein VHN15_13210 [Thermoanaerobaculia bacterium]|nr:hypothetical protein [Thermoanaerobaculia bacterium]
MNKKLKKLVLGKDTVRALEDQDLVAAFGGADRSAIDACPTRLCPTRLDC